MLNLFQHLSAIGNGRRELCAQAGQNSGRAADPFAWSVDHRPFRVAGPACMAALF